MVSEDKTDSKSSIQLSTSTSQHDDDCILFNGIFYLGCASVNAPRSETEALKTISILRSQQIDVNGCNHKDNGSCNDANASQLIKKQIQIVLSVPSRADGAVKLLEPNKLNVIASFKMYAILLCLPGRSQSPESDCFSLTESLQSSDIFQCHVFRCEIVEAVSKVMYSFELAFRSIPRSPEEQSSPSGFASIKQSSSSDDSVTSKQPPCTEDTSMFSFSMALEIKEDDGKGVFTTVPWDKGSSCFKFRSNHHKKILLSISQTNNVELTIERCFGLLVSPGRNLKHCDMHLIGVEKPSLDVTPLPGAPHFVSGLWDPTESHFTLLNTETAKGSYIFMSVAVDLVIREIQEPVRFLIETRAAIYPKQEKFWAFGKKVVSENIFLRLKEIPHRTLSSSHYIVESLESENSSFKFSSSAYKQESPSIDDVEENDEPLLSGSGAVSMECSEKVLLDWGDALSKWRSDLTRRPSFVRTLVCSASGVPEALRGEVWQLLSGCFDNEEMLGKYRHLIAKDSPQENIIQRDIHRTFPAHDYFKASGGDGQESLYRIAKAYSVYDIEVGYCQGLSFLAAALLLHMPEEQAFCVLVKIMYDYHMRDLFKNSCADLHLKFYQLERLLEDLIPNLHDHFKQLNIECHMFSSQWFLTLFTAKFPLNMVYNVLDIFLCEGETMVFQIALALLDGCRNEFLALDFEGILKYFRINLPKKYRDEDQVKLLVRAAVRMKVTPKKLNRYKKDYQILKEKLELNEDPLLRIQKENKTLMEANMRLELENDDIAQELITNRITLSTQLERTMKHAESLQEELQSALEELRLTRNKCSDLEEENNTLMAETKQVKEMCRREMARQEDEIAAKAKIILDYKLICSQLSNRVEEMQILHKEEIYYLKMKNKEEQSLKEDHSENTVETKTDEEINKLKEQSRALELELAQTKLKLVEAECKVQDVEHDLVIANKTIQASKNTWLSKKLLSLNKKAETATDTATSPTSPGQSTK